MVDSNLALSTATIAEPTNKYAALEERNGARGTYDDGRGDNRVEWSASDFCSISGDRRVSGTGDGLRHSSCQFELLDKSHGGGKQHLYTLPEPIVAALQNYACQLPFRLVALPSISRFKFWWNEAEYCTLRASFLIDIRGRNRRRTVQAVHR
jgi:hypothetical protein